MVTTLTKEPDAETPTSTGRRPGMLFRLILVSVALFLSLGFGEVAVRIAAPQPPSWLDVYRRHPVLDTYALLAGVEREVETGEAKWRVVTDENGFRVSTPRIVGGPRTLVLGDSFTFGQGVNHEDSFVARLQEQAGLKATYVNAGVPGYGPIQYHQIAEYLLSTIPDVKLLIIATYVGNDFHDCLWKAESNVVDGILGNRGDVRSFIKRHSHLYRLVSKIYQRIAPKPNDAFAFREKMYVAKNWEEGFLKLARERFQGELEAIARLCDAKRVPLVVVVIPTREAVDAARAADKGEPPPSEKDPRRPIEIASSVLSEFGIRFLDLTPGLSSRESKNIYFEHDGHFTPEGHKLAAEFIANQLADVPN